MTSPATVAPGWYRDPCDRHEYRYWNGDGWSEQVSDDGQGSVDRLDATPGTAAAVPSESASRPGGSGRGLDPNIAIVGIRKQRVGPPIDDWVPVLADCRWGDVPERHRALWEATLLDGEVPRLCSWEGLLVTDRALLVADRWPSRIRRGIGDHADRYEFRSMSDLDENGFVYQGTRRKLKLTRDFKRGTFFWQIVAEHPELAARLVVQPSELADPGAVATVKIGHLDLGSSRAMDITGVSSTVSTRYLVGPVDAVTHRDPARGAKDYYQFVTCPVCGDRLRLHSQRGVLSIADSGTVQVPGGQFVRLAPVHIVDDS